MDIYDLQSFLTVVEKGELFPGGTDSGADTARSEPADQAAGSGTGVRAPDPEEGLSEH